MDWMELDKTYLANTYARFPVTLVRGEGSTVWDDAGRAYTDLSGGIAVNTFGFSDPVWVKAVTDQLTKVQHTSNLFYTQPDILLAKELCARTGMKKVFFSNSGAEANECAIKVARKYAQEKYGKERCRIVTLVNSFHGRTLTTLAATGQEAFHKDYTPLTEGFLHVEANDIAALEKTLNAYPCAGILLEVVQGEGGVIPLEQEFVQAAARLAAEKDILLMADEVQIGNGRSGKLYGYMHYGIRPDVVSTAKGLAGGLPLGATLIGEKAKDVLTPGSHGSTFGGNPVCCAGALSILERLDDAMLAGVEKRSQIVRKGLEGAPGVKSITGLGLMLGIETEKPCGEVIAACRDKGVLVISAKTKVRLLPALNIPEEQLSDAVAIIREACGA